MPELVHYWKCAIGHEHKTEKEARDCENSVLRRYLYQGKTLKDIKQEEFQKKVEEARKRQRRMGKLFAPKGK